MVGWIYGYFGYDNLGDEAILASVLLNTPEFIDPVVLSWNKEKIESIHGTVKCFKQPPEHVIAKIKFFMKYGYCFLPNLLQKRPVVIAGGGCLNDHIPGRVASKLRDIKLLTKLGCKVGLLGVGVNPLVCGEDIDAIKVMFNKYLHYCSVRDLDSYEALKQVDVDVSKVLETNDVVFAFNDETKKRKKISSSLKKARVGLNLRPLFSNSLERGNGKTEKYNEYLIRSSQLIESLEKNVGSLELVPMGPDDAAFLREINTGQNVQLCSVLTDPYSAIKKFSEYDAFIGMRYHSIIFSILAGVACVAIPYSPKVLSLCKNFGFCGEDLIVGDGSEMPDNDMNVDAILGALVTTWGNYESYLNKSSIVCNEYAKTAKEDIRRCWQVLS